MLMDKFCSAWIGLRRNCRAVLIHTTSSASRRSSASKPSPTTNFIPTPDCICPAKGSHEHGDSARVHRSHADERRQDHDVAWAAFGAAKMLSAHWLHQTGRPAFCR